MNQGTRRRLIAIYDETPLDSTDLLILVLMLLAAVLCGVLSKILQLAMFNKPFWFLIILSSLYFVVWILHYLIGRYVLKINRH